MTNLVERPYVGLLFFVPGFTERFASTGGRRSRPTRNCSGCSRLGGKPPSSVLKVSVAEAFLHRAKALIRARLWDPAAQVERSCYPTCEQVLADQIAGADAAEIDAGEEESARTELY